MSIPAHNPLPACLVTQDKKVEYYGLLLRLSKLFDGCRNGDEPAWLEQIDAAAYDCVFDPDIQSYLEKRL